MTEFIKAKYGVAREDRDIRQKVFDSNWRAVGKPVDHHLDPRIQELEAKAKQQALDEELQAAKTHEERELIVLKQRRRADFAAQDLAAEKGAIKIQLQHALARNWSW